MIHSIITLRGNLVCKTGLHIGNMEGIASPRGLDAPLLQNPVLQSRRTVYPYISATALKGKLRNIAEYLFKVNGFWVFSDENTKEKQENFSYKRYFRHECPTVDQAKDCPVCFLFGCVGSDETRGDKKTEHFGGRLIFRNANPVHSKEVNEAKLENTLKRLVREANPRIVERVVPGTVFGFKILYQRYKNETPDNVAQRLSQLVACMRFLEDSYLGGNGSRGSGRVKFDSITLQNTHFSSLRELQLGVQLGVQALA